MSATNNYKVKLVLSIIEEHFGSITKVAFSDEDVELDCHNNSNSCVTIEIEIFFYLASSAVTFLQILQT